MPFFLAFLKKIFKKSYNVNYLFKKLQREKRTNLNHQLNEYFAECDVTEKSLSQNGDDQY